MPNEGRVYFGLSGDFDPIFLTGMLGLEPTQAWARGAKDPVRVLPRCSLWDYSSETVVGEIVDIYEMTEALVVQLEPFAERIRDTVTRLRLSAVLQVVLHISTDDSVSTPAIGFSPRVVRFVAEVGASIDVDTYRSD